MVIVRLIGGLGNQMFQYATARAISLRNRSTIKLDVSFLKNNPKRSYALNHFNIIEEFASQEEVDSFRGSMIRKVAGRIFRMVPYFRPSRMKTIALERTHGFDPSVLDLPGNIYLVGYWSQWKYFIDVEQMIRQDFRFKSDLDSMNLSVAEEIHATSSVSVHVRRGDYVNDPNIIGFYEICSVPYYLAAVKAICREVQNPHFFMFSDDPEWVQENIKLDWPCTYVTHNVGNSDHEDMRLMSMCKHHIIANSSFSWWGAWLGQSPDKIVYAPERWFTSDEMNSTIHLCEGWRTISG